jgi:hypothetical protein
MGRAALRVSRDRLSYIRLSAFLTRACSRLDHATTLYSMWPFTEPTWKRVSASKQSRRDESVASCLTTLPGVNVQTDDEQYTCATASQIVENISNGKYGLIDILHHIFTSSSRKMAGS